MKKLIALLLITSLLTGLSAFPALAAGENDATAEPQMQEISPWAYDALADLYALGLWNDSYYYCILDPVTSGQMDAICGAVAAKLALLNITPSNKSGAALVLDSTRGGVKNALFQEVAAYDMPYADQNADALFHGLFIEKGDGAETDLNARVCTLQEALVLANRLVLALYDYYDAGSLGLLWKATGNGNTLYLLGSIHVDRSNVYPFHKQLRDIITSAEEVIFEVNLNDSEGIAAYAAMQFYSDGTTLKDHISPELYAKVVDAMKTLGVPEEVTATIKPWALATTLQSYAMMDDSTGDSFMAVDVYVNAKAVNENVPIGAVETFQFQGSLFDTLSPEYQEAYLAAGLALFLGGDEAAAEDSAMVDETMASIDTWMSAWKARDAGTFTASFDKEAILASGDELNVKLFKDRDPGMIAAADTYLKNGTGHTYLMVVGAGHMIGGTGIVQGLKDLGYTVELCAAP